jgi:hypothetical protein
MTLVVVCMLVGSLLSVNRNTQDGKYYGKVCKTQQMRVCMKLVAVICRLIVSFVCMFLSWVVSNQIVGSLPRTGHSMG